MMNIVRTRSVNRLHRCMRHAALCAGIFAMTLLFGACDHKELCFHHPHAQTLRLIFDWRDAPTANPEGMSVFFYPLPDDTDVAGRADDEDVPPALGSYYRFNLGRAGGMLEGILPGRYRVITYNHDTEAVLFNGVDDFDGHMGFTREGSALEPIYGNTGTRAPMAPGAENQRIVITPDVMWGCSVVDVEITETGITYLHYPFDPDEDMDITKPITSTEHVITLYPHLLTCYYDYEIRNVTNLDNVLQMSASLSGMSPQLSFGSEELGREPVTIPFAASPNPQRRSIVGNFITWGHHELNDEPHHLLLYVWMKGEPKGWCYSMDVTDQVHAAPDRHYVHLVVDRLELPTVIPPDGDGGFKPSVDDWVVEKWDIEM